MTVSIKDIVSAQRVRRGWHAFVADCEPLQEALHFRSVTAKPLVRSPLKSTPHCASLSGISLHGKTCKRLIVHPVLGRFLWNNTHKLKKAALSNSSASWRRALASQPAVKRLRILNVIVHAKDRSIDALDLRDAITALQIDLLRSNQAERHVHASVIDRIWRNSLLLYSISLTYNMPPGVTAYDTLASSIKLDFETMTLDQEALLPPRIWLAFFVGTMTTDTGNKSWASRNVRPGALGNDHKTLEEVEIDLIQIS